MTFNGTEIKGGEEFDMEQDSIHEIGCKIVDASPKAIPVIMAGDQIVSEGELSAGYELAVEKRSEEGDFVGFYKVRN